MGLDMKTRKKVCTHIFRRYLKAEKKEKRHILDEYGTTLAYNRDYLATLLDNWGKTRYSISGETVVAKPPVKHRENTPKGIKTGRPQKYHTAFVSLLITIRELFDFQYGKLLSPLIREMIDFLAKMEVNLDTDMRTLFETVSPATIDWKLKDEKKRFRLKGRNTTKPGTLLKNQIPYESVLSVRNGIRVSLSLIL